MKRPYHVHDMPKLQCPFVRKKIDGTYVVTPEIAEGMKWVFEDDAVVAVEKLHGTNVSILIQDGVITGVWNRTERVPFFNKGKKHIIEAVLNSYERGYTEFLADGQHFGEVVGPKLQGNPYELKEHLWVPFSLLQDQCSYESWGRYPKTYDALSKWFEEALIPLFYVKSHGLTFKQAEGKFVEGIVFTHPDGRMAKLRRDMFPWFTGRRHKEVLAVGYPHGGILMNKERCKPLYKRGWR